jgi:hypothetical protein
MGLRVFASKKDRPDDDAAYKRGDERQASEAWGRLINSPQLPV